VHFKHITKDILLINAVYSHYISENDASCDVLLVSVTFLPCELC